MRNHSNFLRGDFYLNTIHTFSECRECFWAWEVLEICQKKPVRLGGCNRVYCEIRKAREDMIPWSPLVTVDRLPLEGRRRGFLPSSSVSSSITCLGVILYLHLSSLLFNLLFYYWLWWIWLRVVLSVHCTYLFLFCTLFKLE